MRLLYQCETCGNTFRLEELARRCEAFEPVPTALEVGQEIHVVTRYEGDVADKITAIAIETTYAAGAVADYESVELALRVVADEPWHQYIYTVSNYHEIRKECHQREIPAWAIRELGGKGYWGDK